MSLIERAVARLSGGGGSSDVAYPPRPALPDAERIDRPRGLTAVGPAAAAPTIAGPAGGWPTIAAPTTAAPPPMTPMTPSEIMAAAARAAAVAPALGEPVTLPLAEMRDAGLLIPAARATATGQEFRQVKSAVLEALAGVRASQSPQGRRIAIASSLPGEGKTYCAINLAMSIAASGEQPVLLVDADMVRPSVGQHLGLAGAPGLMDALGGELAVFPLIRPTDVAGLHVLPAGTDAGRGGAPSSQAGELLASRRMTAVLDAIATAFPDWIVVIDTPPLLAVTETRSLVKQAGQVLLVVAAGNTTRRSIQAALAALPEDARTSLVLNKTAVQRNRHDTWYGYGY